MGGPPAFPHLHHVVLGNQDRLLLLLAVGAPLPPHLGPLDPGRLVAAQTRGAPQREEAGQHHRVGELLTDGLVSHLPHVHHGVRMGCRGGRGGEGCGERREEKNNTVKRDVMKDEERTKKTSLIPSGVSDP